jgi:hypothetical protein
MLSSIIQAIKYFALIFSLLLFVVKNLDIFIFNSNEHSIKMDLLEICLNVVDWIGLAQDKYRWRALVN